MGIVKVHVWIATIDSIIATAYSVSPNEAVLEMHPVDRERAQQIIHPETRDEFILGRRLIRLASQHLLNSGTELLRLKTDDFGKPFIPGAEKKMQFSITHSHGIVMVAALLGNQRIGIDCEWIQQDVNILQMAQECMSDDELVAFNEVPEETKQRAFFSLWTQKESFLKAIGKGLSISLKAFEVHSAETTELKILDRLELNEIDKNWAFLELDLGDDYTCCLAIERFETDEIELCLHDLANLIRT